MAPITYSQDGLVKVSFSSLRAKRPVKDSPPGDQQEPLIFNLNTDAFKRNEVLRARSSLVFISAVANGRKAIIA